MRKGTERMPCYATDSIKIGKQHVIISQLKIDSVWCVCVHLLFFFPIQYPFGFMAPNNQLNEDNKMTDLHLMTHKIKLNSSEKKPIPKKKQFERWKLSD